MPPDNKSTSLRTRHRKADYHYFLTYRTRWSDNDQYSHVNNAVYYHLIDSIVNTYLAEQCGCIPSSTTTKEEKNGPPIGLVVSSYCNFFEPISFPEVVTLGLRVVKLGKSSVTYEVGFFSELDSDSRKKEEMTKETRNCDAKAVGGYTHVFVDRIHRRPVKEMNAKLRDGLQALSSKSENKSKL